MTETNNPNSHELEILKKHFGFNNFRPGQWSIINSLLHEKQDVCGILATGHGKSLCYQFPALATNKSSVVISPLISLMQDQKMSLLAKNIPCEVLCGTTKNYITTMNNVINGKYKVIYTTPEFIINNFGFLDSMFKNNCLCLIAVDEAHCISQWGHDFRPSYRQLHDLRKNVPNVPILALTATATPTIQKDICDSLNLKNVKLIRASVNRPNLSIFVKHKNTNDILSSFREIIGQPKTSSSSESFIIYTNSRKDCENVYNVLKRANYSIDYYHAGMTENQRKQVHESFIYDRVPIVVATIAFGMGIDKPNIRKIINWGIPANLETYYQEIGRAGRDGLDSECHLLYNNGDLFIHKFLIDKMQATNTVKEHHAHLLNIIKQWVDSRVCRQYQISSYFEQEHLMNEMPTDDNLRCKRCDNCISYDQDIIDNDGQPPVVEKVNIGFDAKLLIDLVKSLSTNYGFTNLIGILTGTNSKTFPAKLKLSKFYTKGDHHSQNYWKAICDIMIDLGYLKYTKVGGLFQKKSNIGKVFQVVTIGAKQLNLDESAELWVVPTPNLRKHLTPAQVVSSNNLELQNKLKEFRTKCSLQLNLPPYLTLPDNVIDKLLHVKLPTTINKLSLLDGMNTQVILTLGDELITIMNSYAPIPSIKSTTKSSSTKSSSNKSSSTKSSSNKTTGSTKSSFILDDDDDMDLSAYSSYLNTKNIIQQRSQAFIDEEDMYNQEFDNYIKSKSNSNSPNKSNSNSPISSKSLSSKSLSSKSISSKSLSSTNISKKPTTITTSTISPIVTNFIESDDENDETLFIKPSLNKNTNLFADDDLNYLDDDISYIDNQSNDFINEVIIKHDNIQGSHKELSAKINTESSKKDEKPIKKESSKKDEKPIKKEISKNAENPVKNEISKTQINIKRKLFYEKK